MIMFWIWRAFPSRCLESKDKILDLRQEFESAGPHMYTISAIALREFDE